jgi:hypothetical protein
LKTIFKEILNQSVFHSVSLSDFKRFFEFCNFSGNQKIHSKKDAVLESIGKKGDEKRISKVQLMASFGENILAKLRLLV